MERGSVVATNMETEGGRQRVRDWADWEREELEQQMD